MIILPCVVISPSIYKKKLLIRSTCYWYSVVDLTLSILHYWLDCTQSTLSVQFLVLTSKDNADNQGEHGSRDVIQYSD